MTTEMRRIVSGAPGWPDGLAVLERAKPPVLWWRGAAWTDPRCAVAIVGSRRATAQGLAVARDAGYALAALGVVVVSGFAQGIDAAAHAGAVAAGGVTMAVCGCGLDIDYPRGHRPLGDRILGLGGALISEFSPGVEPRPHHFPRRNRLIAALSRAVIVVEGAETSGALSTARWALDLGRDVLAVPGPLHSLQSRGTNRLIRDGARPYLEVGDVLEAMGLVRPAPGFPAASGGCDDPIVTLASGGPVHPDLLAARLQLSPRQLAVRLLDLEIAGSIESVAGGVVALPRQCGGRAQGQAAQLRDDVFDAEAE